METLYVFLIRNDVWIYILSGLGLFWYASQLWQSRRLLRRAMFGLEREKGQHMQRTAITVIVVCLAIIGGVTYVNLEVAPTLPPDLLKPPTPTPNIFATPLSSPTPIGTFQPGRATSGPLAPTVTLRGQSVATEVAPASDDNLDGTAGSPTVALTPTATVATGGCSANAAISAPPNGVTIQASQVTFFGTAAGDGLIAYVLEANGPTTDYQWISILESSGVQSIVDGILGQGDFTNWDSGDYYIRLVVAAGTGQETNQCTIQLTISSSG